MDHPVYVMGRGFVMGDNIKPGERLVRLDKGKTESARNASSSAAVLEPRPDRIKDAADSWDQVVLGSILGDAGIYKKPSNNPYLQEQHCVKQEAYLSWKRQIINNKIRTVDLSNPRSGYTGAEQVGYRSGCSPLLLPYAGFKTSLVGMERLGPLGLAVWYMDDGCAGNGFRISSESFTKDQNEALVRMLEVNFGIKASVREDHREDSVYYYIGGGIEAKRRLVEVCKEHIHPDMAYKFDLTANVGKCRYCGNNYWFYESPSVGTVRCSNPICHRLGKTMRLCEVKSIEPVGHRTVYDFTLANNHTFFGNGLLQKQCVDELDVIPKQNIKAYDQAKGGIPVGRDGVTAFTLFTSTRKSRVGLVQKEIDNASSTGLVLRHWNTIDVTEPCPPSRHLPNGKPAVYYINDGLVKHIDQAAFDILPDPEKPKWYAEPGYEGCAKCRLFPACKGKLATRQKGVVKSFADGGTALLVSITEIASKFRANTPEFVTTEFLCRKPDTSGLVLPRLAEATHFKSAQQIAALVVGEDTDDGRARGVADKPSLIRFLQQVGARFYTGMDFGFSHIFAVVTIAVWGRYAFVIDAVGQSGLEIEQKIDLVQYLKDWNCTVYGDPEDPSAIKSFKTKGFKMIPWVKGPGTVNGGIEILRTKIYSIGAGPTLFFLEGDPMIAACFKQLAEYSFKVDAKGDFSNVPEDVDDDFCDATRYAVMNVFGKNGSLKGDQTKSSIVAEEAAPPAPQTHGAWIADHVRQLTGESIQEVQQPTQTIKKGGFYWGV
jgi:hypothetical protein